MKRLVILDGHALLYRAFHAMPGLTTPDGRPSGAVYGVANVVLRVLRELEPTYVIACFDAPGPTFRDHLYSDYKATRAETPPEVIAQEPMVKAVFDVLAIPHLALPGYEADDLIATLVRQAVRGDQSKASNDQEKVDEVIIVTGDRDLLQLANTKVRIYLLRRGIKDIELLDGSAVKALIGVAPDQILDWKALVGDASDNIIGVPGIGPKTATELIRHFGSLEKLYAEIQNPQLKIRDSIRQSLLSDKDRVFENRKLLKLREDAPIKLDLAAARRNNYDRERARTYLASLGFKTILDRLPGSPTQKTLFSE